MKDVQATLRRIDEEIVGHHQQIARHQVEIMRLQETRKVFMGLAESDQHAADEASRERQVGMLRGEHSRPVLIVRKTGTGDEEGSASKAAKNGTTMHLEQERNVKTDKPAKKQRGGKRRADQSLSGDFRKKILDMMDDETPMSSREIGDYLGLPREESARKGMSNALYQLRIKGDLERTDDKRYVRPAARQ